MLAEIDADFWLQLTLGSATLFLAWAAIFGQRMNHRIFPARLSLEVREREGQLEKDGSGRKYCFHLWVRNSKPWVPIDGCRILLRSMEKKKPSESAFAPVFFPVPRQLIWSPAEHAPPQNTVSFDAVLDLGVLSEGRRRFELIHQAQGGLFEPFVSAGETMRYVIEPVGIGYYDPSLVIVEVSWDGVFPEKPTDVSSHLKISVSRRRNNARGRALENMTPRLSTLYLLNASLLAAHEIDSAFWREWELFELPGGSQLFLALNFVLMVLVLHGFSVVARGAPRARAYCWLMVAFGIFAAVAHTCFLVQGAPQFRTGMSLAIIYGMLLVSLWQATALVRTPRDRTAP